MRRGTRIAIGVALSLIVLLAINMIVVDNQTKSAEVTIDGGRILELPSGAIQVFEQGPDNPRARGVPIVLLHCYACSLHWWDRMAPLLAKRHRVIRVDLLGFGGSEKPSGGYAIPDQAAGVAAALDQLDVEGAVVVGHSMGFAVATALAERASQLVDRLVNIDEGPTDDSCSTPFIANVGYWPVIGEAVWRTVPNFMVDDAYSSAFAPDYDLAEGFPNPDQVIDDRDGMTFTSYRDASSGATDYVDELSLADRLRPLAIPLLSIFGSDDDVCDPEESQAAYETVPGARIAEIRGAGHSPNVEKPKETAALIEEFAIEVGDEGGLPEDAGLGGGGSGGRNQGGGGSGGVQAGGGGNGGVQAGGGGSGSSRGGGQGDRPKRGARGKP